MDLHKNFKRAVMLIAVSVTCFMSFAQNHTVTGTVKDAAGELLIGVSVTEKGTGNGTITDFNGKFSISVAQRAVLVFSYVGYTPQGVATAGKSVIDVTLEEDNAQLDEVVVVGYGTMKKRDLTGSVGSVHSDRIASVGSSSVLAALQGATPGLDIQSSSTRPGASFSMKVRGQNSIAGGNPLYVVDGIVVSDIDYLNPNDIEKIDVLKDASSTAIYGSRGSNGVIMISTKGAENVTAKLSVTYDGFYGVRKLARIPDFMDGREWIDYRTSMYYTWDATNGVYTLKSSDQAAVTQNSKLVHTALYNQDYTDWLALGTKDGSQNSHTISISGSNAGISYNLSLGYQNELGNFILEELDRYTMKGSIQHKPNKYFQAGANFMLSHQTMNSGSQYGYRDILRMPNVLKAYREDGTLIQQPGIKAEIDGDGNFTSSTNPLIEIESGSDATRRFDVLGSIYAQLSPFNGFSIKSTISPRLRRMRRGYYRDIAPGNRSVNQAATNNTENFDWTWDNVLNYTNTFAKVHNVNVTFIQSMYRTTTETLNIYAEEFPYDSQWYNIVKGKIGAGNSSAGWSQVSLLSYAARVNYDYAGKYLFTGTVRRDGSSKLVQKWTTFPSAAVAWRASEENFLKEVDWLSNLKARLSLGYSGNNNGVSAYDTQAAPNTGSTSYYDWNGTAVTGYPLSAPVSPTLTWEKTREWDFGIDFAFLHNRISGTIDFYDKLSDGLLMSRSLTFESGVVSMTDNIGSVSNRGVEISLNTWNVKTRDFEWNTVFNFALNKNAIVSLYGKKEDVIGEARFIGAPINVIYDYKVDGVYTQAEWAALTPQQRTDLGAAQPGYPRTLDMTGEGKITTDDRVILGQVDPKWTGGMTSTMRFKGFDFSFNIYTRQGTMINDAFLQEYSPDANNQRGRPKVKIDYYIPGGVPRYDWSQEFTTDANGQKWAPWGTSTETTNATHPINSFRGSYYGNNGSYQDASFVKVRNITLGYSFPRNIIKKAGLQQARLYVNVLNPFTFTKYIGWDPEYATTSLQNGNGPSSVTYQFGVNVKF